jgi:hypothetical protein
MTDAVQRFSLRDLPIAAKLVLTCFLLAVGGGYTAAMVQLHMQDSKSGEPMPTVADVILKYTGKRWYETEPPKPQSRFVKLLTTPAGAPFNGTGTMVPAFTTRDGGEFNAAARGGGDAKAKLQPQRDGERDVLVMWAESPANERKKAFDSDHFGMEPGKEPKAITPDFKSADGAFRVKSILETRCARCHMPDGADPKAAQYPLQTYEQITKYLDVPVSGTFRAGGDWVKTCEPISLDKLTQSTHAHLLSFAVLFACTGLIFAFTSYHPTLRCIFGPWVLVAVVADVSLWWCARLCDQWGPYFAMGIIGTGGAAGLGLAIQITMSLFNMYGPKGKVVLLVLFALAGLGAWQLYVNKVKPGLEEKQKSLVAVAVQEEKPKTDGSDAKNDPPVVNQNGSGGKVAKVLALSASDNVLKKLFKGGEDGGMARAFFDKDSAEFAAALKGKDMAAQQKLLPARHGEREALLAWTKLPDAERKKAFEADAFPLPSDWAKKPITGDYIKDGKVKVKSLIADRCYRCHDGADEDKAPFNDYESLSKYLK